MASRCCIRGARWKSSWGPPKKRKDLKRATKLLLDAGASPGTTRNKLDRALGSALPDGQASTVESGTVGELVSAYVAAQCEVLASNDVGMRTGTPAVHKTRVAGRRLRSTLRIFGEVFDTAPAEELDNELKWYADVLGKVRDCDILSSRMEKANRRPASLEHVRGPVEAGVDEYS